MLLEEKGAAPCLTRKLLVRVQLTVLELRMFNDARPIVDFEAVQRELDSFEERGIVRICDGEVGSGDFLPDVTPSMLLTGQRIEGIMEVVRKWSTLPLPALLDD